MMQIKLYKSSINSDKTRFELDIHSDTNVLGKGCRMLHDFDRRVKVTGYDTKDGSKLCPTMTCVLAYDHPQTSKPYLMFDNQDIQIYHFEHHLRCPIQCRTNWIKINETTKYQSKAPDDSTNYLQLKDTSDEEGDSLNIPFQLSVVTSYFPLLKPTNAELEDDLITKI